MEHHAGQRFARPLLAMRPTARGTGNLARRVELLLRPRIGARPAMLLLPALMEVRHGPAGVAALIQCDHLQNLVDWNRAR